MGSSERLPDRLFYGANSNLENPTADQIREILAGARQQAINRSRAVSNVVTVPDLKIPPRFNGTTTAPAEKPPDDALFAVEEMAKRARDLEALIAGVDAETARRAKEINDRIESELRAQREGLRNGSARTLSQREIRVNERRLAEAQLLEMRLGLEQQTAARIEDPAPAPKPAPKAEFGPVRRRIALPEE
jgi:hypothetical protein